MKKVILLTISLLTVGLFFVFPNKSLAQAVVAGDFYCVWDTTSNACVVNNGPTTPPPTPTCGIGYGPEVTDKGRVCTGATKSACDSKKSHTCEQIKGLATLLCPNGNLNTAIGCIPFQNTNDFIAFILKWAVGIGGGIAFILIVFSGFTIATSAGNPESLKKGQEMLTAAISGLILLIFAVVVLKIIGIDILAIPGLT